MAEAATAISSVGTVMVPVSDQDRAIEFFVEKLGFEKRTDSPFGDGDRWVEVAPAGTSTTLALVPPREQEPAGVWTRVAFSTPDLDGDHAALRERGVDVDEEIMRPGGPVPPMFWFRDPDSNSFLIVGTG